ncbi:trafficking protein particle complex subunit 2-like protein [Dysidea avara]|uniref:trafficking protein particle complex subunit 2-like protein n=1 Tax=Dysidea avara TaxID=196820 RepID=UPI00332892D3
MAIACIAVISKENFPLHIWVPNSRSGAEADVSLHFLVHTCIDVVEEKVSQVSSKVGDPREHYLGLLYPSENYKIYGYATNSRMKLIIVTENYGSQTRDQEMKQLFKMLHAAYVKMFSNPFYTPGQRITSKWFEKELYNIYEQSKSISFKE